MSYRDRDRSPGRDFGRHLAAVPDELTPADELDVLDPDDWSLAARELFDHEQQRVWAELDAEYQTHYATRDAPPERDATVTALDAVRRARAALDTRTGSDDHGHGAESTAVVDDQAARARVDADDAADGEG